MAQSSAQREVSAQVQVPIVLTGYVHRHDVPSFCRDGADFLLETVGWHRRVRVASGEPATVRGLDRAAEEGEAVVVSGSLRRGAAPGCDLLEVHGLYRVEQFVPNASADAPALWQNGSVAAEQASAG